MDATKKVRDKNICTLPTTFLASKTSNNPLLNPWAHVSSKNKGKIKKG